jgi:WD40 repeat protein
MTSVAFSPDGRTVATASIVTSGVPLYQGGDLRLWDVDTGKSTRIYKSTPDIVWLVRFSPDGRLLATASGDGNAHFWDAKKGTLLATLRSVWDLDAGFVFTADGHIDFVGADAERAKDSVQCRIGHRVYPFELCEERFAVPGLLAMVLAGGEIKP